MICSTGCPHPRLFPSKPLSFSAVLNTGTAFVFTNDKEHNAVRAQNTFNRYIPNTSQSLESNAKENMVGIYINFSKHRTDNQNEITVS